jgi:hypothetical protein
MFRISTSLLSFWFALFRFTFMGFQSGVSWFQEIFARKLFTVFSLPDFIVSSGIPHKYVVKQQETLKSAPRTNHRQTKNCQCQTKY